MKFIIWLFDSKMKVYYVTQVWEQCINGIIARLSRYVGQDISCHRKSCMLNCLVIIVDKRYPSTYCSMQGSCFICSDF